MGRDHRHPGGARKAAIGDAAIAIGDGAAVAGV